MLYLGRGQAAPRGPKGEETLNANEFTCCHRGGAGQPVGQWASGPARQPLGRALAGGEQRALPMMKRRMIFLN